MPSASSSPMLDRVQPFPIKPIAPTPSDVIKLAVLAVGGQGGGVLTDWIVEVAERNGYVAQSTSVAGVAQRTGATIYYIEMAPGSGRLPVFALSPAQGDVDILVAAELMEAGRAIIRGFVTPDRTTLIASSHRIAAVSEKIEPGDGRAPSDKVHAAAEAAAQRFIAFDMEKIAADSGTMISASLLGALAGSQALPFARKAFEDVLAGSGGGATANLRAFAGAFDRAQGLRSDVVAGPTFQPAGPRPVAKPVVGPGSKLADWHGLEARVDALPAAVHEMTRLGLRKVVDYQDTTYGSEYLDRLDRALALDSTDRGHALSIAAAKHIANAMCYDDIIRVADLKTRSSRDARVRREVGLGESSVLHVTEFFHPRIEEFCGTLPAGLGRFIETRPRFRMALDRMINRGRRIRTDGVVGFSTLWLIAGLRRFRRKLLRHQVEAAHLEFWFSLALARAEDNYALAVEILNCRRLIKGYSDTHARGHSKFDRVLSALPLLQGRDDAADWLRRLREAALKDEKGDMLDGALKTIASLDQAQAGRISH